MIFFSISDSCFPPKSLFSTFRRHTAHFDFPERALLYFMPFGNRSDRRGRNECKAHHPRSSFEVFERPHIDGKGVQLGYFYGLSKQNYFIKFKSSRNSMNKFLQNFSSISEGNFCLLMVLTLETYV